MSGRGHVGLLDVHFVLPDAGQHARFAVGARRRVRGDTLR